MPDESLNRMGQMEIIPMTKVRMPATAPHNLTILERQAGGWRGSRTAAGVAVVGGVGPLPPPKTGADTVACGGNAATAANG